MNLLRIIVLLFNILICVLSLPSELFGARNDIQNNVMLGLGGPTLIVNVDPYIFIGHEFKISMHFYDVGAFNGWRPYELYSLRTQYVFSSIRVKEDDKCAASFKILGEKGIEIIPETVFYVQCTIYAVVTGGNTDTVLSKALFYDLLAQPKVFTFPRVNPDIVGVSGNDLVQGFIDPINFSLNNVNLKAGSTAKFTFATTVFTVAADVQCIDVDTATAMASVVVNNKVVTLTMLADVSSINCNIQMTPTGEESSYVEITTSASTTIYTRFADIAARTTVNAALLPAENVHINTLATFTLSLQNFHYAKENNGIYTSNMVTFEDVSSPCIDKTNGTTEIASITASGSVLTFAWLVDPAKTISCTFSATPVSIIDGTTGTDSPTFSMDSVTTAYTVAKTNYVMSKASYSINVNLVSTNYLGQSISVVHDGVQYKSFSAGDVITISSLTCTNITTYTNGPASVVMKEDSIVITYVKDSRDIVKVMLYGVTFTSDKATVTFNSDVEDDLTIPQITDIKMSTSLNSTRVGYNTLLSIDVEADDFESGKAIQFSFDKIPFTEQDIEYYKVKSLSCNNDASISEIKIYTSYATELVQTKFYHGFNITVSNSASFKCDIVLFFLLRSSSESYISNLMYDGHGFSGMSVKIPVIEPTVPVAELKRLYEPTDTKETYALKLTVDNVFYVRDYVFGFKLPHLNRLYNMITQNVACSSDYDNFLVYSDRGDSLVFSGADLETVLAVDDHGPLACTFNITIRDILLERNWVFIQKREFYALINDIELNAFRLPNYPFAIANNQYPNLNVVAHGSLLNVTYMHNTLASMLINFDYPELFKLDGVTPCMYNGEVYGYVTRFKTSALKIPYHGCWFLVRPISTAVSPTRTPVVSVQSGSNSNFFATVEYPVIPSKPSIRYNYITQTYRSLMILSINDYNLTASDVIEIHFSNLITVEDTDNIYGDYTMTVSITTVYITPTKNFDGSISQIFAFYVEAKTPDRQMNITAKVVGTSIKTEFSLLLAYGLSIYASFASLSNNPSTTILHSHVYSREYDFNGSAYFDLNGGELRDPISCGTSLSTNDVPFTYVNFTHIMVFNVSIIKGDADYFCHFKTPTKRQYSLTDSPMYLKDHLSEQPLVISRLWDLSEQPYKTVSLPTVSIQFSGQKLLRNTQVSQVVKTMYDILKPKLSSSLTLNNIIVVSNVQSSVLMPFGSLDWYNSTTVAFALRNTVYSAIPNLDSLLKSALSSISLVNQATFALTNIESRCLTSCGYGCALCGNGNFCLINEDCDSFYCNINGACADEGDHTLPVKLSKSDNHPALSITLSLIISALCLIM